MSGAVVVCTFSGGRDELPDGAEELLTLGRKVGAALEADLEWLVVGGSLDDTSEIAARYGVAAVDRIDNPKLADFEPDATVEALAQYCAQRSPRLLVFGQSFDVRLVAPRLAGRLDWGVVMNAVDLAATEDGRLEITAWAYGGDTRAVYRVTGGAPCVVGVMPNAIVPEPLDGAVSSPAVRDVPLDLSGIEERVRVVERARSEGPRLEHADVIVAGGRGLGSPESFKLVEELADALGGMAGASRPIVDEGWADSSRQVGLTGKITRPALYIAAGISGASQHMAGCAAAKTIAAINRDPDAAIFRYARYGIVGDCAEILPELIRAVKQR